MTTDKLTVEKDSGVAWLTINQPERRNAFSLAMWQAVPAIMADCAEDDAVKAIVLTGAGDKAFSAGNDISEFGELRSTPEQIAAYHATTGRAYAAISGAAKPTIAMIQGFCIGGGLEVSQLCDLQIAADNARFAVTPARLGLGYKYEDVRLLTRNVSAMHAKELLFTARVFDAHEALAMGLINRVAPAAEVIAFTNDYARTIAANAPLSVQAAKVIVHEAVKPEGDADPELCRRWVEKCDNSADYREGQRAFAEKRKPAFTGR